ncbi:MAG TPA: S8 family serine peptidase [Pyrinomonadaceae bacterium]|nr:S8 family serine peptidase [Pyrinomonadaceae bacterium]
MSKMRKIKILLTASVALGLFMGLAVPARVQVTVEEPSDSAPNVRGTSASAKSASGKYVVRMSDDPVVAYRGGVPGLRATKPAKGAKINPKSADVVKYAAYLDSRHDAALGKVGGGRKLYDYRYSFNGFTAELTGAQAAKLASTPGVVAVEADREYTMDTASTPAFLGLDAPGTGLWNQLGGVGVAGEDVIIGVIDSGVWPEHPSFTDRTGVGPNGQTGKLGYQQIPGWHGKCTPGEQFTASDCNQKLIGAQYFYEGRGIETVLEHEFLSARDFNGHGSHTASTAGGNNATAITGLASALGTTSGIAPRARIAVYKVCWDNGAGGCGANTSDSVAAIDQAVADGVDVINYSISGTRTNYLDAVEIAYLNAADAGVFVSTSAGNNGPTATTVAHISPWLAATANGTHNRTGAGSVTLGNNSTYNGASLTPGVGPAPVVRAQDAGAAGAHPDLVRQCFSADPTIGNLPALDPAKVAGRIVLCERGGPTPVAANARVDKSLAVLNAGGVGMILANVTANTLNADLHSVPTVHLSNLDGPAVAAYVINAGAAATASIAQGVVSLTAPAPDIAASSSRGPSLAGGGDILKPDFMAPGTDILAAVAPPGNGGRLFDLLSGTSMASPHVAGIAALLTQAHPDWSPAAMRSAIATTANPAALSTTSPFNIGAGQVRPNLAADPGLVYDAGLADYLAFLKGQGLCCAADPSVPALDASDLNQPSLAVGDLAGVQTLTRTVKNVGATAATYTATVVAPAGFAVAVSPTSFTVAPGATQTYTATITRTNAPFNTFRFGSLTWSDGTHNVRSQIAVRSVALAAPAERSGAGAAGSLNWNITTGYAGALALDKRGLVPAATAAAFVTDDPDNSFNTANPASPGNAGVTAHTVVIPAGTTYARIALFDDFTDGADDLDLYVYNGSGALVGNSGGSTSAEAVNLVNPAAGTYTVYVHGWQTDETAGGPGANYTLFSWLLGSADAGNMTLAGPASAVNGATSAVSLSWSGLAPATKYLGSIVYRENATTHATTIVRIDTP